MYLRAFFNLAHSSLVNTREVKRLDVCHFEVKGEHKTSHQYCLLIFPLPPTCPPPAEAHPVCASTKGGGSLMSVTRHILPFSFDFSGMLKAWHMSPKGACTRGRGVYIAT